MSVLYHVEMIGTKQEIYAVLREYNPWWSGVPEIDLPDWKRVAYNEVITWVQNPPSHRAVILTGARQVGKTTIFRQAIRKLIESGVSPEKILYVTFDHPLLKLCGLEGVIKFWEELNPKDDEVEYLFLDEIQYTNDWETWIKHQVDFKKKRRIAATGSAMPISKAGAESGVGRWNTIKLPTLSFYEYLRIKKVDLPNIPDTESFLDVFLWSEGKKLKVAEDARTLVPHFHEYLLRGGFPETAMVKNIQIAQKLLREDIVDKVLKRDMAAIYGVRNILDLEKVFLYLCIQDGGILDITKIGENLQMTRPTVNNFIQYLESANLVYRLNPYGYGKQILKGKPKVYLADGAIAGSMLLKGRQLLEDSEKLGYTVETVFFKHLYTRYYRQSIRLSYWRTKKHEVDVVAEIGDKTVPFEVKYQGNISRSDFKGLFEFCKKQNILRAYMISRELSDFTTNSVNTKENKGLQVLVIPAVLACYWLSKSELDYHNDLDN